MANKVRRFSGRLKIELNFNDRTNQYKARLCPVVGHSKWDPPACETVYVGPPRVLDRAVDSARAFDNAARAAISFARDDIQEYAQHDRNLTTWHISRGRRRYVKGHAKRAGR
jgi:hypothetical protein